MHLQCEVHKTYPAWNIMFIELWSFSNFLTKKKRKDLSPTQAEGFLYQTWPCILNMNNVWIIHRPRIRPFLIYSFQNITFVMFWHFTTAYDKKWPVTLTKTNSPPFEQLVRILAVLLKIPCLQDFDHMTSCDFKWMTCDLQEKQ